MKIYSKLSCMAIKSYLQIQIKKFLIQFFLLSLLSKLQYFMNCSIILNIYVKCYGRWVAMYVHAPHGIVL